MAQAAQPAAHGARPSARAETFRGTNALELSKQVRQQRQGDILPAAACGANASETGSALTYGEVVPSGVVAMMNSIRAPLTKCEDAATAVARAVSSSTISAVVRARPALQRFWSPIATSGKSLALRLWVSLLLALLR